MSIQLTEAEISARMEKARRNPEVVEAMEVRCSQEGHGYENCCTPLLQVYARCPWCGERV